MSRLSRRAFFAAGAVIPFASDMQPTIAVGKWLELDFSELFEKRLGQLGPQRLRVVDVDHLRGVVTLGDA